MPSGQVFESIQKIALTMRTAEEYITKVGNGGISDYNSTEANRLTKVLLFMK